MSTVIRQLLWGAERNNPVGLRLNIRHIGDKSHFEFSKAPLQIPRVSGGIFAVLLSEAMFHAIAKSGIEAVTVAWISRYRRIRRAYSRCEGGGKTHEEKDRCNRSTD